MPIEYEDIISRREERMLDHAAPNLSQNPPGVDLPKIFKRLIDAVNETMGGVGLPDPSGTAGAAILENPAGDDYVQRRIAQGDVDGVLGAFAAEVFWTANDSVEDDTLVQGDVTLQGEFAAIIKGVVPSSSGTATLDLVNLATGNSVLTAGAIDLQALGVGITTFALDPAEVNVDAGSTLQAVFVSDAADFGAGSIAWSVAFTGR